VRVVIVGATGNAGTSLVEELAAEARVDEIVGVARRLPYDAQTRGGAKTRFLARDMVDDDLTDVFRGADAVVHLAWFFQPTHRPETTWRNNVGGSARVFDAVASAGVPVIVYASSVGAYSPGPGRTVDESWPTDSLPVAGYGREKAYVERLLDRFELRHPDVRVVRMRPAFLCQEPAASEQRRIFAGPFVPNVLARRVPVLPFPAGLRFQALATRDAAAAYRAAILTDVRGAFNLAAAPVIDGPTLADALGARLVTVPPATVRAAMAAAWHLRLGPAEPGLFDLVRVLPTLDTTRATLELLWSPRHSAIDAILEFVRGMAAGRGTATPPMAPDGVRQRADEVLSGVGSRVLGRPPASGRRRP
jgi:nucleoside-diphosphate-sugar epimerase